MDPVVHFEMPYENAERVSNFYESAFGWKPKLLGEEMGRYLLVTTAEPDGRAGAPIGAINGGLFPKNPERQAQYASVVIAVTDVRASMTRVNGAGGKVLGEATDIPGVGLYVSFLDTEGNRNGMLQPVCRT